MTKSSPAPQLAFERPSRDPGKAIAVNEFRRLIDAIRTQQDQSSLHTFGMLKRMGILRDKDIQEKRMRQLTKVTLADKEDTDFVTRVSVFLAYFVRKNAQQLDEVLHMVDKDEEPSFTDAIKRIHDQQEEEACERREAFAKILGTK